MQKFVLAVEKHVDSLNGLTRWGSAHPADAIFDLVVLDSLSPGVQRTRGADVPPFAGNMLELSGSKLGPTVAKGLTDLTTAILLCDVLLWLKGGRGMCDDVLKHRARGMSCIKERVGGEHFSCTTGR